MALPISGACSVSARGITTRGIYRQVISRNDNVVKCPICDRVGYLKRKCPLRFYSHQTNNAQQPQQHEDHRNIPRRQHNSNGEGRQGPVWCLHHKTTTHGDGDGRAKRGELADGSTYVATAGPCALRRICSAHNLPEEDERPEPPYLSFTATEYIPWLHLQQRNARMRHPGPSTH